MVQCRASVGIVAPPISIEVNLSSGLPNLNIVGLAQKAVCESKDRVRSAILNSGFTFPVKRITVNLAPADLPKEGGRFDLPIALGILAASKQIPCEVLADYEFAGELGLSGELRAITAVLPFAAQTIKQNKKLIIPRANGYEASFIRELSIYTADHLQQVVAHITQQKNLLLYQRQENIQPQTQYMDLQYVVGQTQAKRALEIAAAGGHSVLFSGPPGTGKTLLSSCMPSILPPMTETQAQETAAIYSVSHLGFQVEQWRQRPFRAPHHSASGVALVGGGRPPKPGEVSLAHHGILFLDELPEFPRHVLDMLREPLESGTMHIARAGAHVSFPACFQLLAAMNPCPCGYYGDTRRECRCTQEQVQRYQARLSGPFLDRIDMRVTMSAVSADVFTLKKEQKADMSHQVRERVIAAQALQIHRRGLLNAQFQRKELQMYCQLTPSLQTQLHRTIEKLALSTRAYHRILKVARTIADLEQMNVLNESHVNEAVSYFL